MLRLPARSVSINDDGTLWASLSHWGLFPVFSSLAESFETQVLGW